MNFNFRGVCRNDHRFWENIEGEFGSSVPFYVKNVIVCVILSYHIDKITNIYFVINKLQSLQNRWVSPIDDGENSRNEHDSQFAKVDAIIPRVA